MARGAGTAAAVLLSARTGHGRPVLDLDRATAPAPGSTTGPTRTTSTSAATSTTGPSTSAGSPSSTTTGAHPPTPPPRAGLWPRAL